MIIQYGITGILTILITLFSVNLSAGQDSWGKIKCVCIDAGHGGRDPGAVGTKSYEKNIVLAVAMKLGKMIGEAYPDIKVVYIRNKDVFVELGERTRIANSHKADLFISVHANALDVKKYPKYKRIRGIETYVLGSNNSEHNLQVAIKENSVIHFEKDYDTKYEGFDPSRAESYIMFNMLRNLHLEKSLSLASFIHSELVKHTGNVDREVRQGPLWVLKDVAMPATLVEIGYISNPEDERYMMSSAGQTKIAQSIFNGFKAYKKKVEQTLASAATVKKTASQVAPATGLQYAIQIASAAAKVDHASRLCNGEKVWELEADGRYRYYVAPSATVEEVKKHLGRIRGKVKDCFIIAIHKGQVITFAEARKLEQK